MADDEHLQQQAAPSGFYSGRNKIPTVNELLSKLDKDKKERDRQIDERRKNPPQANEDVKDHVNEVKAKAGQTTVTDPVTGNQVVIEDVNKEMLGQVENPTLSVPNANLGKDTTHKTEATQKNPEYKEKQDITAPPDPIAEGSTSDVPIHGEKTNILFHPTPSISYEPMFNRMEERGMWLIVGTFFGIIILGRTFGGSWIGISTLR